MKEPGDNERLLKEYFHTPLTPSPRLVLSTLRRIQGRGRMGIIAGLMALQWLVFILMAGFFLTGPAAQPGSSACCCYSSWREWLQPPCYCTV